MSQSTAPCYLVYMNGTKVCQTESEYCAFRKLKVADAGNNRGDLVRSIPDITMPVNGYHTYNKKYHCWDTGIKVEKVARPMCDENCKGRKQYNRLSLHKGTDD